MRLQAYVIFPNNIIKICNRTPYIETLTKITVTTILKSIMEKNECRLAVSFSFSKGRRSQAILNIVFVFLTQLGKVRAKKYFKILCIRKSLRKIYSNKQGHTNACIRKHVLI